MTSLNGLGTGSGLDSLGSYSALQQYTGEVISAIVCVGI